MSKNCGDNNAMESKGNSSANATGCTGGSVNLTQAQSSQHEAMITFAFTIPSLIRWATTVIIIVIVVCSAAIWWKVHGLEENQSETLRIVTNINKRTTEAKKEIIDIRKGLVSSGILGKPLDSSGNRGIPRETAQDEQDQQEE